MFVKVSTKTHAQITVQNEAGLKNVFKKSHPFTKGSVGACMQIVNLTVQHHITKTKKKSLYMCYENVTLREQNSIASSHTSNGQCPHFFCLRPTGDKKETLPADLPR